MIKSEIIIGGEKIHNSPTATLKQHIINALNAGADLSQINKIVFVDSSNVERDYTTSLTYDITDKLTITGTIDVTDSYSVAYIRLYAGTNAYFEASKTMTVNSGDRIQVTVNITVSLSGTLGGSNVIDNNFSLFIYKVLAGQLSATALNIVNVIFRVTNLDTNETYDINGVVSKAVSDTSISIESEISLDYPWALNSVSVKASDKLYTYTTNYTGEPASIKYTDTLTIQ